MEAGFAGSSGLSPGGLAGSLTWWRGRNT